MKINLNAPLVARREVFIDAPIEAVWRVLTDFRSWPTWQPDIGTVTLDGELTPGAVFRWQALGSPVIARLMAVEPPRHIGWTSGTPGMTSTHVYMLEAHGARTRVVTEESLAGWVARVHKLMTPHLLDDALEATLERLKQQAERG